MWPKSLTLPWWIGDPNLDQASFRRLGALMGVLGFGAVIVTVLFGSALGLDKPDAVQTGEVLTACLIAAGIYATRTPSNGKAAKTPPAP